MALTAEQQASLKHQLEARYAILRDEVRQELIRSDNEHYVNVAGLVHDHGDESVADLLVDVELAVVDQHVNELREIEAALQRVGSGAYGICESCGVDIAVERLQSMPTASRCINCQAETEGEDKHGTPRL